MAQQGLDRVRDWASLWAWVRDNKIPVGKCGKHCVLVVGGSKVFVSRTPGDRRSALNAWSDIRKALKRGQT